MRGAFFYHLLFLMVLTGLPACSEAERYSLSPHDFVFAFHEHPGQLIDLRSKRDWRKEHLPGAMHLDVADGEAFKRSINRLSRRQAYYVYCYNGNSSAKALLYMRQSGFTEVYLLRGGLHSLRQEGYSVAGF